MNASDRQTEPRSAPIASLIPTLAAASARILPSDEGPGAAETGVGEHIGGALEEPSLRPLARFFDRGCQNLDQRARECVGVPFAACDAAVQDDILAAVQQDPDISARFFFEWLVKLTLEGFLCDPVHGGNRDQLGWRFIGYHREEPRTGFCLAGRGP